MPLKNDFRKIKMKKVLKKSITIGLTLALLDSFFILFCWLLDYKIHLNNPHTMYSITPAVFQHHPGLSMIFDCLHLPLILLSILFGVLSGRTIQIGWPGILLAGALQVFVVGFLISHLILSSRKVFGRFFKKTIEKRKESAE